MITNKINAILLSLLLLIPTFGISIEKHFCGGQLADVALFTDASCACDEEGENNDCCREEDKMYQMNLKQFGSAIHRLPEIAEQDLLSSAPILKGIDELILTESVSYLQDLPPPQAVPCYLMNCSFTFYG